jgi:hypothetical protein
MIDRKLLVFLAFLLTVSLGACGGDAATPTQPSGGAPSASPKPTATTSAETEATETPSGAVAPTTAEEAALNLDSVSSGIAQLDSYKSSLSMTFTGTNADGQAVDRSWTMEEQFIKDPAAQSISWSSSESKGGESATTSRWEMITIGENKYMITQAEDGAESCMMLSSSDSEPLSPALTPDMWGSISDARYKGTETVNGVRAKHYAWKEGTLTVWGFTKGQGETWVAVDGGYVVRQIVEGTGSGVFLAGTDETGTTKWEWNVTEANGSFAIEAPEGCDSAAADIPVMADATDKSIIGDMITYTSPSPLADVAAFYKAEMPKAGWEATGTPTEMDGLSQLEFSREGSTASVMISWDADNGVASVFVSVTKPSATP